MTLTVVPIRGDRNKIVHVVIFNNLSGHAVELYEPEAEAVSVQEPTQTASTSLSEWLDGYASNSTALHADRSLEVTTETEIEALEAADKFLAIRGEFVTRSDFTEADWRQQRGIRASLDGALTSLDGLSRKSVLEIPEEIRRIRDLVADAQLDLEALTLQPLRSRTVSPPDAALEIPEVPSHLEADVIEVKDVDPKGLLGRSLTPSQRDRLSNAGILSIEQLIQTPDSELLKIPGFGPTSVASVRRRVPNSEATAKSSQRKRKSNTPKRKGTYEPVESSTYGHSLTWREGVVGHTSETGTYIIEDGNGKLHRAQRADFIDGSVLREGTRVHFLAGRRDSRSGMDLASEVYADE